MISTEEYIKLCKDEIKDYIVDKYNYFQEDVEVIQVWYCKTIQNHKGLFIVKVNGFENEILNYFIECTYNGDTKELYLDFYKKEFKHTERIER